jgi:hypothetical protein
LADENGHIQQHVVRATTKTRITHFPDILASPNAWLRTLEPGSKNVGLGIVPLCVRTTCAV